MDGECSGHGNADGGEPDWVGGRHGSPTYSYVAEPDKQKQVTHEKPIDC